MRNLNSAAPLLLYRMIIGFLERAKVKVFGHLSYQKSLMPYEIGEAGIIAVV